MPRNQHLCGAFVCFSILCSLATPASFAGEAKSELSLSSDSHLNRTNFFLGVETVQMNTTPTSFFGFGPRAGLDYAFAGSFSIQLVLSQLFYRGTDGFGYLFTGLGGSLNYSLFGSLLTSEERITSPEKTVAVIKSNRSTVLTLGGGVEQLLINGSSQIYGAPGMFGVLSYYTSLFDQWLIVSARGGNYTANHKYFGVYFLSLSFIPEF